MHFEVASCSLAIFTSGCVYSSQKFASFCVHEDSWEVIHIRLECGFSLHVLQAKELNFPHFPGLTLFSNREVTSTVEHGSNLLHRRFVYLPLFSGSFVSQGFLAFRVRQNFWQAHSIALYHAFPP